MLDKKYRIPSSLSLFQETFYKHLINWKWKHVTTDPGLFQEREYDALLPDSLQDQQIPVYKPIIEELRKHDFKPHKQYGKHMASSQAACINLFTPLLRNPDIANEVLSQINPSFKRLATDHLESGFQFEYWDTSNPLNDHTPAAGTDSDIAIAYYNDNDELCLWLIEHKLTEKEFSTCGGYRSSGNKNKDWCRSQTVLADHDKCYYQHSCDYKYWKLTDESNLFNESAMKERPECPFLGGENQLWRNQLMAFAIQKQGEYKNVHFSVVLHHSNLHLDETISRYKELLNAPEELTTFTSRDLIKAAEGFENGELQDWIAWFKDLYLIS